MFNSAETGLFTYQDPLTGQTIGENITKEQFDIRNQIKANKEALLKEALFRSNPNNMLPQFRGTQQGLQALDGYNKLVEQLQAELNPKPYNQQVREGLVADPRPQQFGTANIPTGEINIGGNKMLVPGQLNTQQQRVAWDAYSRGEGPLPAQETLTPPTTLAGISKQQADIASGKFGAPNSPQAINYLRGLDTKTGIGSILKQDEILQGKKELKQMDIQNKSDIERMKDETKRYNIDQTNDYRVQILNSKDRDRDLKLESYINSPVYDVVPMEQETINNVTGQIEKVIIYKPIKRMPTEEEKSMRSAEFNKPVIRNTPWGGNKLTPPAKPNNQQRNLAPTNNNITQLKKYMKQNNIKFISKEQRDKLKQGGMTDEEINAAQR